MTRDTKMLQLLLDGQRKLREEMKEEFKEVRNRLDMQGSQVAYLEDDLPAIAALKR